VAQLGQGLGLNLADALPSEPEGATHVLEGVGVAPGQAEPEVEYLLLAVGEGGEGVVELPVDEVSGYPLERGL